MTEQKTLREAANNVVIEGLLLEVRHQEWKSGKGLSIELDIEVAENEIHTVHGMSQYKKKDGSDNGIAKGYNTVIEEYKSVASHGRDEADKVRINQGKIGVNEYYGEDGMLRSFPQLSSNFFNRLSAGDAFEPKAEFEVEIFVKSVVPEMKDDEETGRAKIKAIIPVFGGRVIPFEFVVSEEGAEYVQDNYEVGSTTKVFGNIVNFKEKKVVLEKAAFGKDKEKVTYNTVREYLVNGGVDPYEEDDAKAYTVEQIQAAMVERETYLEEMKNKEKEPKKEDKKTGFGSKASSEKKDAPAKKKVELPF
ncbi:hypothetical protein [Bacillus sp. UMB0728]|uniref:hypothetical protein n=1 Tax=Bacillus sp. UMB0728 TaxID=2066052 RepID=UPI000C76F05A|nr:hypothetical protein [Bacillus sp. UMB0728]PLR72196.1 hypothetical protein CYJ37_11610 [Bacillus sp. UMB0728]